MTSTTYSRELRKLTLFYLPKPRDKVVFESIYTSIRSKKPREIVVPGVVVSSLRPIRVCLHYSIYRVLEKSRAYVVPRFTSNTTLHISDLEEIAEVNDVTKLRGLTGKPTPIPTRLLYMIKDREPKAERLEPKEVANLILLRQQVYALTAWPRLLDILFSRSVPAVQSVVLMPVWNKTVKLWTIPQKSPLQYLSIESMRLRLKIPEALVTRLIRYDPSTDILLIVQPLQSISLNDLRKMIYRRPTIPLTREEAIDVMVAQLKGDPEIRGLLSDSLLED
jgi:hypothetical protein